MVYCTKCGTKNEDDAVVCIKCGASLETKPFPFRRFERKRVEEECFGIPRGSTIVGLAIGIIIMFGILIVIGALYSLSRRR